VFIAILDFSTTRTDRARSNAVLRPMVTDGPVSRRFRAELVESVA
jgi:hypothetical protein